MKKLMIISTAVAVMLIAAVCAIASNMHKRQILDFGIGGSGPVPVKLPSDARLVKVSFSYNIAMNLEGSYTYTVTDRGSEEGYWLEIESPMYDEDEVFETKISEKEFAAVKDLVGSLDLDEWNDYHKYAKNVLDGSSFSSSFVYATGDGDRVYVNASGTNASPEGYGTLKNGMQELFGHYKKQYDYDRIPKTLKSDNLESLFVTFKQQGDSGYSDYSFEFRQKVWEGGYNINAHYLDYTGEFGPAVKRSSDQVYILVKDIEKLDLSPIQAIIRKYDIPAINGYDVAAEDYNNSEWFQISASYKSEDSHSGEPEYESINIMGTEKFSDYDAFRHDFLEACIAVAQKYQK